MSSTSNRTSRYSPKFNEICIGNFADNTEPAAILTYFEKFGKIIKNTMTSSTNGFVFITYEDTSMVDACMSSRPHYLEIRHLYVKRSLPVDDDHPRERFETTRDLMIVIDFNDNTCNTPQFLNELRDYFSKYGRLYGCKYCHETNFDYIFVEFADNDQVDRIILDKPHYYNNHQLDVMKYIPSNIEIMNAKYASNKPRASLIKDAVNDDNHHSFRSRDRFDRQTSMTSTKEPISETDLQDEVYRLQNVLRKMNEDFAIQRRELEDDCSEQLKQLNENIDRTHNLQQDLEQEHAKLLIEYESIKHENETLNEQYLIAELENFEISSYYEQILAEEKATTAQLEAEYTQKLQASTSSLPTTPQLVDPLSSTLTLPSQPSLSNDN